MSYGFHAHPGFQIVGAADAQRGKPSSKPGSLNCNATYLANIGVEPVSADLSAESPAQLRLKLGLKGPVDVLSACAPCTGFSRMLARNHAVDDARNSLVERVAAYAADLRPRVIVMENARELVTGRFSAHLSSLTGALADQGYEVSATVHRLDRLGLPQRRERALVVAVARGLTMRTLDDLWQGLTVRRDATLVRRALAGLPHLDAGAADPYDPMHLSPRIASDRARRALAATPHDGGSWRDLASSAETQKLLTPSMLARAERGDFGSHPDVYGRMWWDRPAPTIKRECGHIGNGRYAHPEQDRLCTVREMALLQGFPRDYLFAGSSIANMYRHIGDAVPPLISYQVASLVNWILTGQRPAVNDLVLAGTTLTVGDIVAVS